ncbi:MAG TPA: histidinol-phosphate transaminase [Motiliproteus sp.]
MAEAAYQHSVPSPVAHAVIDLSANENPLGPSPKVAEAIRSELNGLHRYPSREGTRLCNLLANQLIVDSACLMLGNGASELLDVAARTLLQPGDQALIPVPSFMPYQKVVERAGAQAITVAADSGGVDLQQLAAHVTEHTRLVILGNPNNPTGAVIHETELRAFMTQLPERVIVVIDEAYVEYVDDPHYPDCIRLVQQGAPLLVLRSLSKAYGLAGLRIGYAIGSPHLIARLNACCQFYNTNALAQAAACAALQDQAHLNRTRCLNREGIDYLTQALSILGFKLWPSQANFVLAELPVSVNDDAEALLEYLAQQGVLLKSMRRFGLPRCVRISTGLMSDNHTLVQALTQWLQRAHGNTDNRPVRAISSVPAS